MTFLQLSEYLQRLDDTTKRLEITDILAELITKLDKTEIEKGIYLSLGYLKAPFENPKFNIAETMMVRAMKVIYPQEDIENNFAKVGDLGSVAYMIHAGTTTNLTITSVYEHLLAIAQLKGTGSQGEKIMKTASLLKNLDKLSAKYAIRIILGTTRLGFTELTILSAINEYINGNKKTKILLENAYTKHPDIGLIAKEIKRNGVDGLSNIKIETGVPLRMQKAQRLGGVTDIIKKFPKFWAEFKFDGTRVQLHVDKTKKPKMNTLTLFDEVEMPSSISNNNFLVKTFTRNMENSTHQFPDIVEEAKTNIKASSIILDGEAIGYDKKTGEFLPFQEIMQRKRKYSIKEFAKNIPVKLIVFDILYLDGKSTMDKPLTERHKLLERVIKDGKVIQVAEHVISKKETDLQSFYNKAKKANLEGLIVKKPGGSYKAGARSFSWVKLKTADEKLLEDSVDVVVLGYYFGKGERSKFGVGGFLAGIYDEKSQTFKTISKVGTGLKDTDLVYLKKEADKYAVKTPPANVEIPKQYLPNILTSPKIVVEVGSDEISKSKTHSAGYALRFPRLLYFRTDKNALEITTLKEIKQLHDGQKRGVYYKHGNKK